MARRVREAYWTMSLSSSAHFYLVDMDGSCRPLFFDLHGNRVPLSSMLLHKGPSVISPVWDPVNRVYVAPVRRLVCEIHCRQVSATARGTDRHHPAVETYHRCGNQ